MHQQGWNRANEGCLLPNVRALDRAEKEHLVFHDRAAQLPAILILLEPQRLSREIIECVEFVITQEFPRSPVKLVGSRTKHDADHRAAATEFSTHRILFYAELLDGIGWRLNHHRAIAEFVVVHAIEKEVIVEDPQPID